MRIYLDNCCYNRPYDDQLQLRIVEETQAILYIQNLIRLGKLELVTSYVLSYENNANRVVEKLESIDNFIKRYEAVYVGKERAEAVGSIASEIMKTGVKLKDALHVSCAILTSCDYFITTDIRLLKYKDERIKLVSPDEFVRIYEEEIL